MIIGFLYLVIRSEYPCHTSGRVALLQAVIDLNNVTTSFKLRRDCNTKQEIILLMRPRIENRIAHNSSHQGGDQRLILKVLMSWELLNRGDNRIPPSNTNANVIKME